MNDDKYEGLGLSDEEIAAMEDELSEGELAQAAAEAAAKDDPEDEDDQDDADDAQDDAGEAEAAKVDDEQEVQAKPAEKAAATQEREAPASTPSKLDALTAELAEVKQKFDDGDLSIDEYIEERDRVSRAIVKAELKAELANDEVAKAWERSQKDFLGQNAYLRDNDVIYDAFAMQVNKLLADPQSASMSDDALLAAAKQKVDAAFGLKPSEPSRKKDESLVRDAKKDAADRSRTPKTLRDVPAAAAADDVDQSPYAYLDRLKGDDLEAALMKLSDDEQRRWAHSQ